MSVLEEFHSEPQFFDVSGDRQVIGLANDTGILLLFFDPNFASNLVPYEKKSTNKEK
mgnify:CR=1 FL=1